MKNTIEQARTIYRAQFRNMAAAGVAFDLSILPVSESRPTFGVVIEPACSAIPGSEVIVRNVHAMTEAAVVAQFSERIRSVPTVWVGGAT